MIAALLLTMSLYADFAPNATLPKKNVYTDCGGANVSPMLRWSDAPSRTRSFVLTVFDPDAPRVGGWWHWIAYNIPSATRGLAAGSGAAGSMSAGTFGKNDFGDANYDGPCPPPGRAHRYVFTVYALNVPRVSIANGPAVELVIRRHVLAKAQIIGRYGR
jgi:Raf kinase inhibitor-like YbhB/YbcL family protein